MTAPLVGKGASLSKVTPGVIACPQNWHGAKLTLSDHGAGTRVCFPSKLFSE